MGENLRKIGKTLFSAREEQGIETADIAARLRISEHYLRALENGDASALPERVYTEAYIVGYAKILDISSDNLVELYREDEDIMARNPAICFSKLELQLEHLGGSRGRHHHSHFSLIVGGAVMLVALLAWYMQGAHYQSLKEELFPTAQQQNSAIEHNASLASTSKNLAHNDTHDPKLPVIAD